MKTVQDLRLLILTATGAEPSLTAIKRVLGLMGTPYDVIECVPAEHQAEGGDVLSGRLAGDGARDRQCCKHGRLHEQLTRSGPPAQGTLDPSIR